MRIITWPVIGACVLTVLVPAAAGRHGLQTRDGDLQRVASVRALPSDFNGDGVADLAIGVPGDTTFHPMYSVGGVNIQYGVGPDGTRPAHQFFGTESPGIKPLLRMYPSGMGWRLASGDFDRDGFADLAITVRGFDEPDPDVQRINVGGVVVVYGTPHGLDPRGAQPAQVWSQDSPGVQGVSEDDDYFGSALAIGDFDGDRFLDLAVGANGERIGPGLKNSGALTVLYGGRSGLTGRDQVVTQDTRGILDAAEANDWASGALAAGDFDSDGVDDLALGVSSEGLDGKPNAGAVNVIYGTRGVGLNGAGDRFVHQGLASVAGIPSRDDLFGATLTVGDFNGDDHDDLVVGAPLDQVEGTDEAGSVTVVPGSSTGLVLSRSRQITITDLDLSSSRVRFGAALSAGDVDDDGDDDLAVTSSGRVDVLDGGDAGLSVDGVRTLRSEDFELPGDASEGVSFGMAVQLAAFDTTPGADLAVGLGSDDLIFDGARHDFAGAAVLVLSRSGDLGSDAYRWMHQGIAGVRGTPDRYEGFGSAFPGSADYRD